ncbi:MAG TPA: hypothetical protein VFU81_00635, partial [Thermomicrobiales bacterium]|nr:hypothetical protein [Thermomicrobiales bacterium]
VAWLNAGGCPEPRSATIGERTRAPAKANLCSEAGVADRGDAFRYTVYAKTISDAAGAVYTRRAPAKYCLSVTLADRCQTDLD